eukprot:36023-Amphidinium_carterae.1
MTAAQTQAADRGAGPEAAIPFHLPGRAHTCGEDGTENTYPSATKRRLGFKAHDGRLSMFGPPEHDMCLTLIACGSQM